MKSLSGSDLRRAVRFLNECCVPAEPELYLSRVLEGLFGLIPADHWACGDCGTRDRPGVIGVMSYPEDFWHPPLDIYEAVGGAAEFPHPPIFVEIAQTSVSRISDIMTPSQWHERPIYREFYRHIKAEDDLSVYFQEHEQLVFIGMTRGSTTPQRDLELANAVIRPILAGFGNARSLQRLEQQRRSLTSAVEAVREVLIVCNRSGGIIVETGAARQLLLDYFSYEAFPDRIPDELLRYASDKRERLSKVESTSPNLPCFSIGRTDRRLVVDVVVESDGYIFSLHQESEALQLQSLLELGLSEREAQVLSLVTMGKTNAEIGIILGISRLTVGKHMEHVLERLGVETRTAAAAMAIEARLQSKRLVTRNGKE